MTNNGDTIKAAILGAFLGFLATLVSTQIASYMRRRSQRTSYCQYLSLELDDSAKSIDAVRTAFEHQRFYDFLLLDLLDKNVENLQDARRKSYLIKSQKIREALFGTVNRLALLSKDMRSIQQYSGTTRIPDSKTGKDRAMTRQELANRDALIADRRSAHGMEMIELKRAIKDLTDKLG